MGFVMLTSGHVCSGLGKARSATVLGWFRGAVQREFGFDPSPGTLNLKVGSDWQACEHEMLTAGTVLVPPSADYCCALLLRAGIGAGSGSPLEPVVIVRPLVPGYDPAQVECVAPVHLRSKLGLQDGDQVAVELGGGAPGSRWVSPARMNAGEPGPQRPLAGLTTGQAGLTVDLAVGPLPIWLTWSITGQGVCLALFGGIAHVGATALATPRPSLVDPSRRSATSSVLTVSGHKDDLLARQIAESLAARLDRVVSVTVGIHAGPEGSYALPPADADRILSLAGQVCDLVQVAERTAAV